MKRIAIYADGADLAGMARLAGEVQGFTTNPSLMRKAGVTDYAAFAKAVLGVAGGKPVSFEVLADDLDGMVEQAHTLAGWGPNVVVKIPIRNTGGESTEVVIRHLSLNSIAVNVTAVMTPQQVREAIGAIRGPRCVVSIFAGRIADAGVDPRPLVSAAAFMAHDLVDVLWASPRQVYDVIEAERAGADIITLTPDLIAKAKGFGVNLERRSIETVQQFQRDAEGITL